MRNSTLTRCRKRRGAAALAFASMSLVPVTASADKNWNTAVPDGSWNTASNWVESEVPVSSDNVFVSFNDTENHNISYDGAFSSELRLLLRNLGSGTTTFLLPSETNLQVGTANIGGDGRAVVTQSAGMFAATNAMRMADSASGNAVYNLYGGTLEASNTEYVGENGNATFNQTGGQHYISSSGTYSALSIGHNSGSSGSYHLSGTGELVAFWNTIGRSGSGTFTQTGSSSVRSWGIQVGSGSGSSGIYELSGSGSVFADWVEWIGMEGAATFTHSGGTNNVGGGGGLYLAAGAGSSANYILFGTAILSVRGDERIGTGGTANFRQTGGTNSAFSVYLGDGGTYTLDGGTLAVEYATTVAGYGRIDYNGGVFSAASLDLSGGGRLILSPVGQKTLRTTAIAIDTVNGSKLDMGNNRAIVDYTNPSPIDSIRQFLQSGSASGWSGNGITSSSAAGDSTKALGYGESAVLGLSSFGGYGVDPTCVLIKFTWKGDANLDGQVDISDLGRLATAWQTSSVWSGGDFNYDGFVDISDLGILATNWQAGVGNPLGPASLGEALSSLGLPGVSVPEPGALGLAVLASSVVCRPRRAISGRGQIRSACQAPPPRVGKSRAAVLAAATWATLAVAGYQQSMADTHSWVGGSGTWQNASNWNPAQLPANGDRAVLNPPANQTVVEFSDSTPSYYTPGLGELYLTCRLVSDEGLVTLNQTGGMMCAEREILGELTQAKYAQAGGSNTVTSLFALGFDLFGTGTYYREH